MNKEPVIIHVHVPKTAGSSFRKLLDAHFGDDHEKLYVDDTFFVYDEEYLDRFIAERPNLKAVSSHFIRTFPPYLGGRQLVYVAFLRDPVEQFLSYLTYTRKYYAKIPDQNLLACLPSHADEMSLAEVARWVLSQPSHVPFAENYVTNFFSRYVFQKYEPIQENESKYFSFRSLLARHVLDSFFLVGITEKMEDSLKLLSSLGKKFKMDVPQGEVETTNVSRELRGDTGWTDPEHEIGSRLHASIQEDRLLYEWAFSRLSAALA